MNIKEAKQEIKNAVAAYLEKDKFGNYIIPVVHQRPLLLMGAPGIGKTAIMEQVARECGIGLVSYTITHHTRQSAIGLPFIKEKEFGGKLYSVTEYTMSEIIASVYEKIKQTGIPEGILFIDEINCVSETLAPAMLQFLQGKTFGSHNVPDGYVIVAAGNPPEYNKSVREFDVVTLDRLKKIDVAPQFEPWKEYAYTKSVHGAIMTYLEIKENNFYSCETTIDGKAFVTARGWEDLSEMLYAYERLDMQADYSLISQYLQLERIARDFANYLELYNKYKTDYHIEDILNGKIAPVTLERLNKAPFDERLSVIGLLLSRLNQHFVSAIMEDLFVTSLHIKLTSMKETLTLYNWDFSEFIEACREDFYNKKLAGHLTRNQENTAIRVLECLEGYKNELAIKGIFTPNDVLLAIRRQFNDCVAVRQACFDKSAEALEHAFDFLEKAFGESQEMVVFITELTMNQTSLDFINQNGCDRYYRYNQELLFSDKQRRIITDIEAANGVLGLI